ncbi:hypothetical protein CSV71_08050 [Sporosarcina sp. P21c]|uniref:hypothetical protein n=1 Tax=unclassified Sporosarcina TaxID=2647733 RepID=UPI000C172C73|nr:MULTISPECIES: hypothetical protein [unclassified Sporosarcina]PIC66756.1 hypothetical protein CSV78_11270 [Sporosarcina sp. P16a]PIC89891.1 hypothetical protein CSV71_08050 [Sporosarcina sp. P21c]PIC93277.1 hypothetical protein CSV70_06865 [Sporosarcina sp. P25]
MDLSKLEKEKLAQKVLLAPLVSLKGKHQWPRSTFQSYVFPEDDDLEGQFVKDLLTLNTPDMIEKWYGGEENALTILLNLRTEENKDSQDE